MKKLKKTISDKVKKEVVKRAVVKKAAVEQPVVEPFAGPPEEPGAPQNPPAGGGRTKYKEHLMMVEAIQFNGTNLVELEAFAPGGFNTIDGKLYTANLALPVNPTDWIIDQPYLNYITVISDTAFHARFDATPAP